MLNASIWKDNRESSHPGVNNEFPSVFQGDSLVLMCFCGFMIRSQWNWKQEKDFISCIPCAMEARFSGLLGRKNPSRFWNSNNGRVKHLSALKKIKNKNKINSLYWIAKKINSVLNIAASLELDWYCSYRINFL